MNSILGNKTGKKILKYFDSDLKRIFRRNVPKDITDWIFDCLSVKITSTPRPFINGIKNFLSKFIQFEPSLQQIGSQQRGIPQHAKKG